MNAQIVNIPDANFKAALLLPSSGIDTNNDGEIQVSEAEAAIQIKAWDRNISSMEGLEYFINITDLSCHDNQIEFLDVSQNTKLEFLICYNNQITTLNLGQHPNLTNIVAFANPLTSIDLSGIPVLDDIIIHETLLTEIDVTHNPILRFLTCDNMKLTTLDVSQNPQLLYLYAHNNELVSVNIKNGSNINIDNLVLYNNPDLECIQVDDVNYANSQICDLPYSGWCKDATASYSEDCQLGTEDFTKTDFQLFPNPAGNLLNIQSKENIENVKIYSPNGLLVKEVSSNTIDVSQLSAGMYFAQITFNGKSFTRKFIKE